MHSEQIELKFQRLPSALAAVLFGIGAWLALDAAAFGNIDIDMDPAWMWGAFAIFGFAALVSLKNTLFPKLIFVADIRGITIGRGLFINRLQQIPWQRLSRIEEGIIKIGVGGSSGSNRPRLKEVPAVKLVFDEYVDIGRLGYKMARPSKRRNYLIAGSILRQPLTEAIATLKKMKERYG
jgi:hypothetical protein